MTKLRSETLTDFAEHLVVANTHRMKHRFDGRRIKALQRNGLLVYPDGTYSLSVDAMLHAIKTWEQVAKDRWVSEERRAELLKWSALGRAFVARHETIGPKTFSNIVASRYLALWSLVVSWCRQEVFVESEMTQRERAVWASLEKHGYVTQERRGQTLYITPTPAGDELVISSGNPHFA